MMPEKELTGNQAYLLTLKSRIEELRVGKEEAKAKVDLAILEKVRAEHTFAIWYDALQGAEALLKSLARLYPEDARGLGWDKGKSPDGEPGGGEDRKLAPEGWEPHALNVAEMLVDEWNAEPTRPASDQLAEGKEKQ